MKLQVRVRFSGKCQLRTLVLTNFWLVRLQLLKKPEVLKVGGSEGSFLFSLGDFSALKNTCCKAPLIS